MAVSTLFMLFGPALGLFIRQAVARQREYLADAEAVLLTRDPPWSFVSPTGPNRASSAARPPTSVATRCASSRCREIVFVEFDQPVNMLK